MIKRLVVFRFFCIYLIGLIILSNILVQKSAVKIASNGSDSYPYHKELWFHKNLNIHNAWHYTLGNGIIIAVLDSGVNKLNEIKDSLISPGYNSINDTNDVEDEIGHGTFVSSIIAAQNNNEDGYVGLSPKTNILPVKVYSKAASEDQNIESLARGIKWAVDNNADIINISIGYTHTSANLENSVLYACQKGVIVISASGNNGSNKLLFPAAIQGVIPVAASNKDGEIWRDSNYNSNTFLAPGDNILGLQNNIEITNMSGTSLSTPIISAIAAMKKSISPYLTNVIFSKLLKNMTKTVILMLLVFLMIIQNKKY